ncbi:MAG: hypothetical protein DCC49_13595, partial [Acidobacteria bacterium]
VHQPFRYAGYRYEDGFDLYYLRARWMDPGTGRFLSRDVIRGHRRNIVSLNRYLYAAGSPPVAVDPAGTSPRLPRASRQCQNNVSHFWRMIPEVAMSGSGRWVSAVTLRVKDLQILGSDILGVTPPFVADEIWLDDDVVNRSPGWCDLNPGEKLSVAYHELVHWYFFDNYNIYYVTDEPTATRIEQRAKRGEGILLSLTQRWLWGATDSGGIRAEFAGFVAGNQDIPSPWDESPPTGPF